MAPDTFRAPWWEQVVEGRISLRYAITAVAVVPGVDTLCEITAYMHAGVWTAEEGTKRIPLPMFSADVATVAKERSFEEWDEKFSKFGAFARFDEAHEFVDVMPFTIDGKEFTPPVVACELFLGKGDGWRMDIPEGHLHAIMVDGKPKMSTWKDAAGLEVVRTHMGVKGFDVAWLTPPPERIPSVITIRAVHRKREINLLGTKPMWVKR